MESLTVRKVIDPGSRVMSNDGHSILGPTLFRSVLKILLLCTNVKIRVYRLTQEPYKTVIKVSKRELYTLS